MIKDGWFLNDFYMKIIIECLYLMEELLYIFLYYRLVFLFIELMNEFKKGNFMLRVLNVNVYYF